MQYLKNDVREKILKAAIAEFKENGYANASIRNIAVNAHISLGNIYRYFTNKEALYCAVVEPLMEEIVRKIDSEFEHETWRQRTCPTRPSILSGKTGTSWKS